MRSVVQNFKESMEVKTLHRQHINMTRESEDFKRTRDFMLKSAERLSDGTLSQSIVIIAK